jgi:hypothetical protein
MTAESDQMKPPAPAESLEVAAQRFLDGAHGDCIGATDFLRLCDEYVVKLSDALRNHIGTDVLRISANSITTTATVRGLSANRALKSLTDKLLGLADIQLKLRVDMIPKPLHGQNLRKLLGSSRWSSLRQSILADRDHACEVCGDRPGSTSDLHAHEVWEYDLDKKPAVVTLSRIGLLCPLCHSVEHLMNSIARISEGSLPETYLDTMRTHFCKVNGVGKSMWDFHAAAAMETWKARSRHKNWAFDLGQYAGMVNSGSYNNSK